MTDLETNGSWKSWFDACGGRLLLFARQWACCASDAEDIVHDGFVRFWKSGARAQPEAKALLYASIRRAGLDRIRRDSRRSAREQRAGTGENGYLPPFRDILENLERNAAIESALHDLPDEQREVVVLKIWAELTFEQIGTALEIPANTAASRYRYALSALRKTLQTDVLT